LQTYFTIKGRINYFIIMDKETGGEIAKGSMSLIELKKELFKQLKKDYKDVKCDLKEQATIV
jgi:hypothetical protein